MYVNIKGLRRDSSGSDEDRWSMGMPLRPARLSTQVQTTYERNRRSPGLVGGPARRLDHLRAAHPSALALGTDSLHRSGRSLRTFGLGVFTWCGRLSFRLFSRFKSRFLSTTTSWTSVRGDRLNLPATSISRAEDHQVRQQPTEQNCDQEPKRSVTLAEIYGHETIL